MGGGVGPQVFGERPPARPSDRPPVRPSDRPSALRVCADPNNLPFSNRARAGFENRIAELVARELHRTLTYAWWPQRRGFVRNTLDAGRCDLVMGMPTAAGRILATAPYYTSTYVFLSRRSAGPPIASLDDPRLRQVRIGLHFIGDDYHNTPAATALARRGIVRNVVGYSIYGDYAKPNPPAALVFAVARREVDVAIVWGPFAGYFGPRTGVSLVSTPVVPAIDGPGAVFAFAISAGVRRSDTALRAAVDRAIVAERPAIRAVLARYGVPMLQETAHCSRARHPERGEGPFQPSRDLAAVGAGARRSLASLGMTGGTDRVAGRPSPGRRSCE